VGACSEDESMNGACGGDSCEEGAHGGDKWWGGNVEGTGGGVPKLRSQV
jgi:hypothetical protein